LNRQGGLPRGRQGQWRILLGHHDLGCGLEHAVDRLFSMRGGGGRGHGLGGVAACRHTLPASRRSWVVAWLRRRGRAGRRDGAGGTRSSLSHSGRRRGMVIDHRRRDLHQIRPPANGRTRGPCHQPACAGRQVAHRSPATRSANVCRRRSLSDSISARLQW
jgi:hypothetical protein